MTDTRERMKDGRLYFCTDEEIANEQLKCLDLLYDYNQTRPTEQAKRRELLKVLLAEVGENCYIEPPLHANWGRNTHLGSNVYANFNLTLVDDTDVYIGDSVMIGPNVTIATAGHPIVPELRREYSPTPSPSSAGTSATEASGTIWTSSTTAARRYARPGSGLRPISTAS